MSKTLFAAAVTTMIAAAGCSPSKPPAQTAAADAATQKWAALAKLPDWSGVWEVDWRNSRHMPPKPPMKLTPEWQAKADAYRAAQKQGENLQSEAANCVPPGLPGESTQPYPIEFLYQPGKIVILYEAYMQFRHIWMDGRQHAEDPDLTFYGDSTGFWDGDTLVIDTIRDQVSDQIVHRSAGCRIEGEVAVFAVTCEQPFSLERAADALGDPFEEVL